MPSRRYFITYAPVAHINGKLSRVADKVKNNPTSDDGEGVSFYYGYRKFGRTISRYGYREKARDLSKNPYTTGETRYRKLFADSANAVYIALQDEEKKAAAQAALNAQEKYVSLRPFCIAMTIRNGGIFPF